MNQERIKRNVRFIRRNMVKIDTKLMIITLACLCQSGEQPIYPVYGKIRKVGKKSVLSGDKVNGFIAATNRNRLLVAEFLEPGVLTGTTGILLKNIKSVMMEKTLLGNISVKIDACDNGEEQSILLIFPKSVNTMDFPYQKLNLDSLLNVINNRERFCELSENAMKETTVKHEPEKQKTDQDIKVIKKGFKGPDPVAMLLKEKTYALELCERLEAKYGRSEFGKALTESEIHQWELKNNTSIPDDLREWLKFAGESRFKGIPLEFYPIENFQKTEDYIVIGQKRDLPIAYEIENGRYITVEGDKRKNLGRMETILRFWGYDAKELFAEEELEKLRPVIEEETAKMNNAKERALLPDAGLGEAMEYFMIKNTIGYLKQRRCFPHCPVRKDMVDCGLLISAPDREGYYQWKPKKQTNPVDFAGIEAKLGFILHKDIRELVSSWFYFMLEGDLGNINFHIHPLLPTTDIENYVIGRFDKEDYVGNYSFITGGHFFHLGGACIDGDDAFVLEVNNENGEVLAVEYMDKKHIKIADSLRDLFMDSRPIWYKDS